VYGALGERPSPDTRRDHLLDEHLLSAERGLVGSAPLGGDCRCGRGQAGPESATVRPGSSSLDPLAISIMESAVWIAFSHSERVRCASHHV
jgi:hypothetical protein